MAQLPSATDLDLRLLRVFRTIVDNGGLKRAAERLNVGLPTVSKQLSDLEIRLGMRLCSRGGSIFELSEEGAAVYQASTDLFGSIETFRAELLKAKKRKPQLLRIAVVDNTVTDDRSPVAALIRSLETSKCHITVSISQPGLIEAGIMANYFDLGIVPIYEQRTDLVYKHLYDESSHLYCGAFHRLFKLEDSEINEELVLREPTVEHSYVNKLCVPELDRHLADFAVAVQLEAVLFLILSGRYLGFLPEHYARKFIETSQIKKIHAEKRTYNTKIGMVYKRENNMSIALQNAVALSEHF